MSAVLYIKSMVCVRCKMAVQTVLEAAGADIKEIALGWVELNNELSADQLTQVQKGLNQFQLELIPDKTGILLENIKREIARILQAEEPLLIKLSVHLSQVLGYNYTYLANSFSAKEGITLERYFISQRIERLKALMICEEISLNEIKYRLSYSSVSHLCQQFKKVTGITPTEYRKRAGRTIVSGVKVQTH